MKVMTEYATSRHPREIRSVNNSSVQGNAKLMKMFLLRMQRHVFVRFCYELTAKNPLKD